MLSPGVWAFVASLLAVPLAVRWLLKRQVGIHIPRERDIHRSPTPRLGGVVIGIIFWLVVAAFVLAQRTELRFVDQTIWGIDRNLLGILLGSLILIVVGAVDDIRGVRPGWKLVWQILAALMLPFFGIRVQWLAHPFGGEQIILSGFLDGLIAVIWIVLMVNVFNFLDGLDGLASTIGLIATTVLFLLAVSFHQPALAVLLLIFGGSVGGFLVHNWHPARMFLGDSGSQFLGYLIGVAAIISGGKLATAGLIMSLPILDALWTVLRRLVRGQSPFQADRGHLHHRLLELGLSQPVIVLGFAIVASGFGWFALQSQTSDKVQGFLGAILLMIIILAGLTILDRVYTKTKSRT